MHIRTEIDPVYPPMQIRIDANVISTCGRMNEDTYIYRYTFMVSYCADAITTRDRPSSIPLSRILNGCAQTKVRPSISYQALPGTQAPRPAAHAAVSTSARRSL